MNLKIKQELPIFWSGKLVKLIKWDSLNMGGKLKIKVRKSFIEVDISELSNLKNAEN